MMLLGSFRRRLTTIVAGDAAHAMTLDLGQGANAAMVDALVLLRLLAPALRGGGDLAVVGRTYQAVRHRLTTDTQALAGWVGWLGGLATAPGRLLQRTILGLGGALPVLGERARRLTCGLNPAEEPYLAPVATSPWPGT